MGVDGLHPDAVVVGAGHNGLVAAAYLARAGRRVLVCERRDVVGGAAVTEELAPGFRVSTASYSLSLFRPDIFDELNLADLGVTIIPKDPRMFVPLPDGRSFYVWRDTERTKDELERIRGGEGEAYVAWDAFWEGAVARLRPLVEAIDPPPLADVLASLPDDVRRLAVEGSAADCVSHFFAAPELQGAFASQGIIGTWASVHDPGTAWVLAYHALGGELCGATGTWAYVRGGMGSLTQALARAASAAGAEVRTGCDVVRVLVEGGRARGVELADGTVVTSPIVLSNADPVTTFAKLVPAGVLEAGFAGRVAAWSAPGSVLKVNLALSEAPAFGSGPGAGADLGGTIEIAPSLDYLEQAYEDAARGRPSRAPFMEVYVQSAVDRSLVDGDGHVLSAFTQYVPPQRDDWPAMKQEATANVIDTIAAYAPNVREAIVAIDALGPPELEERFGLVNGNIFHGEILPGQSFGNRFDYRTPVAGLYLCGSGARPGGAVTGAPGRNAATVVLRDLGRG